MPFQLGARERTIGYLSLFATVVLAIPATATPPLVWRTFGAGVQSSVVWLAEREREGCSARVGIQFERTAEQSAVRAVVNTERLEFHGRWHEQYREQSSRPMSPAPVQAALLDDLSRAFVIAEYGTGQDRAYAAWILDIATRSELKLVTWVPNQQLLIGIAPIPGTRYLVEHSICAQWGRLSGTCETPPLLVRVLDDGYSPLWEESFDIGPFPEAAVEGQSPAEFVRSGKAELVTATENGFEVLCRRDGQLREFRLRLADGKWGVESAGGTGESSADSAGTP